MGHSREQVKDAIKWDGSSSIDGTDPDWYYDILERADPKRVAEVQAEVDQENRSMADAVRTSRKVPTVVKQPSKEDILAEERRYRRSLPFHFIQD